MYIRSLTAHHIRLPLWQPFSHASLTRHDSDNLVVRCELANGTIGWGEGVPRDYVTGETCAGALAQLAATPLAEQLASSAESWPEVIDLCRRFAPADVADNPRGSYGNALRSAVELSLLDAFGKLLGEPVARVTEHLGSAAAIRQRSDQVYYSTAIGSAGARRLRLKALKMRAYGFRQCKVKVGAAGDDDARRLRIIRRWIGPSVDIRIDANEAWPADSVASRLRPLARFGISCLEQPCPHREVNALAEVRRQIDVPLMLDESLTSRADAEAAIRDRTCDLFNIRLSKCGGFLGCLELAALAREAGLGYQLGCHPGESGILSAAGRHWATSVAGIRYLEGSYDRHLLRRNITCEDVTFGYGGRGRALEAPGLGVTIDADALRAVTVSEQSFPFG